MAGTIGAIGNNGVGVVGVNWKVQMAALKFQDANGRGSTSEAAAAVNYAVAKGFDLTNNSWGGGGYSSTLYNAINNARLANQVFVAAAGNNASNNDVTAYYPANYALDNVVAVAATDHKDALASFSNYGATTVDLAAPGVSIRSTVPGGYANYSGTSMATPHVSGALALVLAQNPTLTYTQLISQVLSNVDAKANLSGMVATGGRLNVFRALNGTPPPTDTLGPKVISAVPNGTTSVSSVRLTFNEPINASSFTIADITDFTGPNGAIAAQSVTVVSGSNNTQFDVNFATQTTGGSYSFTVGPNVLDAAGNALDQNGDGTPDTYQVNFTVTAAPTYTFTNSTPVFLPDRTTVISTLLVGQSMVINDMNVVLNIRHTFDSDLYVVLRAPDNTTVLLVNRRGSSGDNFTNTTLDDEAAIAISNGRAPFSGSYRPEQPLSRLDGKNALGTWRLEIRDLARRDTGTLLSWSMIVQATSTTSSSRLQARAIDQAVVDPGTSWHYLLLALPVLAAALHALTPTPSVNTLPAAAQVLEPSDNATVGELFQEDEGIHLNPTEDQAETPTTDGPAPSSAEALADAIELVAALGEWD